MPVLVERIDVSKLSENGKMVADFLTEIPSGAKNVAILDHFPTGKEPICVVNCKRDNTEANFYVMKPYRYLPVVNKRDLIQVLVFDRNEDDFEWQRIATLTPDAKFFHLPIKTRGKFDDSWIRFTLV